MRLPSCNEGATLDQDGSHCACVDDLGPRGFLGSWVGLLLGQLVHRARRRRRGLCGRRWIARGLGPKRHSSGRRGLMPGAGARRQPVHRVDRLPIRTRDLLQHGLLVHDLSLPTGHLLVRPNGRMQFRVPRFGVTLRDGGRESRRAREKPRPRGWRLDPRTHGWFISTSRCRLERLKRTTSSWAAARQGWRSPTS